MTRTRIILAMVLITLVGCAFGWFLWQWRNALSVSPVQSGAAAQSTKTKSRNGYCCVKPGSACEEVTHPGLCFRGGGKAFNAVKQNCDYYCLNVKP